MNTANTARAVGKAGLALVRGLTESERQKRLEMEVIATDEGDDESAETRKTIAQLTGV